MTINKFTGKTKEEAIQKAKEEFGPGAVIMNVKEIKPKGIFQAFKSSSFEVTAAMEEKEENFNPMTALKSQKVMHDNINLAADEKIEIPKPVRQYEEPAPKKSFAEEIKESAKEKDSENLKERLDNLSNIVEEKLGDNKKEALLEPGNFKDKNKNVGEEFKFARMIYNTLINNEVDEKYVNQIIAEVERFLKPGNSVDSILSNVYQKLILKFGQAHTINLNGSKPKVIFFIGPTGVGKTTTIAKIASKYKVDQNRKVAFITADTYRIAATEQLRVYANILDAPMSIVYSPEELNAAAERMAEYDMIFVDTAGFSHKNTEQKEDVANLISSLDEKYEREVYLVLSATTKYNDLTDIIDIYKEMSDFNLIFTKLDETTSYGNILNIKLYSGANLSYVTDGQNVPDDIEVFNTQKIVKQLLGGR